MEDLNKLEHSELIDKLADYTSSFTRKLYEKKKDADYHHAKQMIKLLIAELQVRKDKIDLNGSKYDYGNS